MGKFQRSRDVPGPLPVVLRHGDHATSLHVGIAQQQRQGAPVVDAGADAVERAAVAVGAFAARAVVGDALAGVAALAGAVALALEVAPLDVAGADGAEAEIVGRQRRPAKSSP